MEFRRQLFWTHPFRHWDVVCLLWPLTASCLISGPLGYWSWYWALLSLIAVTAIPQAVIWGIRRRLAIHSVANVEPRWAVRLGFLTSTDMSLALSGNPTLCGVCLQVFWGASIANMALGNVPATSLTVWLTIIAPALLISLAFWRAWWISKWREKALALYANELHRQEWYQEMRFDIDQHIKTITGGDTL